MKLLQENNFDVKAPQSSIEDAAIAFLLKHFNGKPEPKKEEEPAYTVPVKRESNVKKNQEKKKAQEEEKKVEEIARLLGGTVITQTTLKSARELIEGIEG